MIVLFAILLFSILIFVHELGRLARAAVRQMAANQ